MWQSTVENYINCIAYANGYGVVGGSYYNGSTYYARIAYTTDLSGTWTTNDLWSCESSGTADINCITYANGDWVAVGVCYNSSTYYARIAYTTDLSGTWTTNDLWSGSTISRLNSVTYANGYWVAGGVYSKSISFGTRTYYARIAYTDPNKVTLPTISADKSYAYIKAKG